MTAILNVYIPTDRRHALARGESLPEFTQGAVLFADISGFTPLTEALVRALGPKQGAEELTHQLNRVYNALIAEVDRYGGSVIGFAGDAITCWFGDEVDGRRQAVDGGAVARAVACALAMQAAMSAFVAVPIPDGSTVSLAMKAAIASGSARRFLVGDPAIQQMDALAGETLVRMTQAEHVAERGEVVVDAATAALLGAGLEVAEWRQGESPDDRFAVVGGLRGEVAPAPWPPFSDDSLPAEELRSWLLPPIYDRLRAGLGEFMTEMRPAAVLFLSFTGIDYDHDPEAGRKLDLCIRRVQDVLTRYAAALLQLIIGDKGSYLYATFGAPVAHEDDVRRAAAAALELRALPAALDFIRPVQIGLTQGTLRTGAYGGDTRRTYGVLGDEVNLAARLMQAAPPGEIWATARVRQAVADIFVWEDLPPVQVKGKRDPIPVARLAAERQRWAGGVRPAGTLVGRQRELAAMLAALARTATGAGQILRLQGDAGVGKSYLSANFTFQAVGRGARVAIGTCQATSQEVAYFPWRSIFYTLLGVPPVSPTGSDTAEAITRLGNRLARLNPEWQIRLPLLSDLLGLPIPDNATTAAFDPRLRQDALFALAVHMVQTLAQRQPLLLVLEDVHWMDEASLGLTLALGRIVAHAPVVLLLIQRPPVGAAPQIAPELNALPGYQQLDLTELPGADIAALIAERLGGAVSETALALIQAQAQGNPFYAEELIYALREGDKLVARAGIWDLSDALIAALREAHCVRRDAADVGWTFCEGADLAAAALDIPHSVQGAVLARLDRLPEQYKLTLKVASVIGRVFDRDTLANASPARPGQAALQAQLDTFGERDFVHVEAATGQTVYLFRHNITQEVVYNTLLATQQRELHRAVARVLETAQPEAVEPLAYHFGRGDVHFKTLFYLDKAAQKAQRAYANETALNYYAQALLLEDLWEWRKGQIEVLHILGRREEELAALQALEASQNAPAYEVAYLWGQYYEAVSDYGQAQAAIERALGAARDRASRINEANCLAYLGLIARRQGDYERAKDWYGQALALFQRDTAYSPEEATTFAQAFNGLGIVQRQQGEFDAARASYEQALALSRQSGNQKGEAEALNGLGVTAYYQRNFYEALTFYQSALEIQRAIGDRIGEGTSLLNLAQVNGDAGDYHQAENYYLMALTIQQTTGNRWEKANVCNSLGVLYQELGILSKAENYLGQSLQLSQDIGDEAGQAYVLANLGLLAWDQGDRTTAERLLTNGLTLAMAQNDKYLVSGFVSYLGMLCSQVGQYEQAIQWANQALDLRHELNMPLRTTADLTTLAVSYLALDDTKKALNYATQARDTLEQCQGEGPEFPQQDYFICYQVFTATGKFHLAQEALCSAYSLVMERANKIKDITWRQSFLENVPINRQIVAEARRVLALSF